MGVLESGYHFPLPGADLSSHRGPRTQHSSATYSFSGLGSYITSPAPKAFEVATGNSSSVGPTPSKAVFLVSECVKHYQIQNVSGLWWHKITLDFGDIGKKRKRQKKHSGPFHSITRLVIRRESWSPNSNSHLWSPVLLCLQSDNSNGREAHHHLEKHMSCYGIDSSNCWKYLPSVEPNSAFQWLTSIVSIESCMLHA